MKIRILTTLALLSVILVSCGGEKDSDLKREWGHNNSSGGGHDSHSSGGGKWIISCYGKAFDVANSLEFFKYEARSSKSYKSDADLKADKNELVATFVALRNNCSQALINSKKLNNAFCSNINTNIALGQQGSTIAKSPGSNPLSVALDWKCEAKQK